MLAKIALRWQRNPAWLMAALFVLAGLIRIPLCRESFWVDELHSAWCVNASFSDVSPRATLGNQQPFYFQLLWIWKEGFVKLIGDEHAITAGLRLSSVLLVSSAVACLAGIAIRSTGKLTGMFAGLALAIQADGLFFGTELRPYAGVIFFTTMACAAAVRIMDASRPSRWIDWFALHTACWLAFQFHVTSVITLGWLLVCVTVHDVYVERPRRANRWLIHSLATLAWIATAAWFWFTHAQRLWQSQGQWETFAMAKSFGSLIELWPWLTLMIFPMMLLLAIGLGGEKRHAVEQKAASLGMLLFVLSVSTLGCFVASKFLGIPLWHRRYLIAGLPILCLIFGEAIGRVSRSKVGGFGASVMASALLLILVAHQGSTKRGEDWRGAIAWINSHQNVGEAIRVDPDLIEQSNATASSEYLTFAVRGPYAIESVADIQACRDNRKDDRFGENGETVQWLLTRRRVPEEIVSRFKGRLRAHPFGRVTVYRWESD